MLVPYLCWTVIYFFVTLPQGSYTPWTGFAHFWYLVGTGYYQLYYLLVIMQFYVVFPLLLLLVRRTDRATTWRCCWPAWPPGADHLADALAGAARRR